jgi:hypothetical protein
MFRDPDEFNYAFGFKYSPARRLQIFPYMNLCGLVPNSYIHVSVRDLYIPMIGPPIFAAAK